MPGSNFCQGNYAPGTVLAVAWGLVVAAWLLPPDRRTPPNFTRSLGREGLEPGGATGGTAVSVRGSAVQSMAAPIKQSTCQPQCWDSLGRLFCNACIRHIQDVPFSLKYPQTKLQ